jgi:acetate kinase
MIALVLLPDRKGLGYSLFTTADRATPLVPRGRVSALSAEVQEDNIQTLRRIRRKCLKIAGCGPDTIAIRVTFGGFEFDGRVVADEAVTQKLEALVPLAPLHLPLVLSLVKGCGEVFPGMPVVLDFETGFFAGLPAREHLYGLNAGLSKDLGVRRYGYHGIYHEAACRTVTRGRLELGQGSLTRMVSICLEPRSEVAAVLGRHPVMVTSGVTPVEGLPGQTSCGELDPSIVLTLAEKMGWGPEQINKVLTHESGLLGLVGRPVTLEEVFRSKADDVALARAVMQYRFLLAFGAAVAALGGLDVIVFSGRYAALGEILGPQLMSRLPAASGHGSEVASWTCFSEPLERILADNALGVALQNASPSSVVSP